MPVYDNDGSSSREIGLLYDNNGSSNSQIAYVYDNNGSSNSLIYQLAPNYLYYSGNQYTEVTGGWDYASPIYSNAGWWDSRIGKHATFGSVNVSLYTTAADSYNGCGIITKKAIDFSGIKELKVTCGVSSWPQYNYIMLMLVSGVNGTVYTRATVEPVGHGGFYYFSLNTASYNSSYKVYYGVYTSYGHVRTNTLDVIQCVAG